MDNKRIKKKKGPSLREKAEEKFAGQSESTPEIRWISSDELIHKLQTCQIELDMQSEELYQLREELKASRKRYFEMFDLAPVGCLILSEKELIIEANFISATLLGVEKDALTGKSLSSFIITEDQDIYYRLNEQLTNTGKHQGCELRLKKKDGVLSWVRLEALAVRDSDGRPGLRAVITDINEHKKMEAALRESEYFFRESQRAAHIGSYKADFTTGFWESSEVLDQIFGIDRNYNRSIQNWLALVHPDDREMMDRYLIEEVIAKGEPFDKEYRILRNSDHKLRWVHGAGEISYDSEKHILFLTGTIWDITERKILMQKIEDLAKFPSENPDPVLRINSENEVIYMNEPVNILLIEQGLSEKDIFKILPDNLKFLVEKALNENKSIRMVDVEIGSKVFSYNIDPVVEKKYVNLYGRDITEKIKIRDQLEAKNAAIREVLMQLEIEKNNLQKNILANVDELILPALRKFKPQKVSSKQISMLERNLENLTSSFGRKISDKMFKLTPKEIEICNLIRSDFTNKDIADHLNLSVQTVEKHRKNIRSKLGILNKKQNLRSYLQLT